MLDISEVKVDTFKAYKISNQHFEVVIAPKLGGRVSSFSDGEKEFFFTLPNLKEFVYDLEVDDIKEYRLGLKYLPLGGYKTWLAPQQKWDWPPYLDLEIGDYNFDYKKEKDYINFKVDSPICRESGIKFSREFIINSKDKKIELNQQMINKSSNMKEYGLWDVTQLKGQGQVVIRLKDKASLFNLMEVDGFQFTEFLKIGGRLYAIINCPGEKEFKLGVKNSSQWILSLLVEQGQRYGYLKESPCFKGKEFGHGAAFEIFDTYKYDYFEVEVHGPIVQLSPNQKSGFREEWSIYSWDKDVELKTIIRQVEAETGGVK